MTSSEWEASVDVPAMLRAVSEANRDSARSSRLFAAGCGRLARPLLTDDLGGPSVEVVERYVDRQVGWDAIRREYLRIRRPQPPESPAERALYNAAVDLLMMLSTGAQTAGQAASRVRELAREVEGTDLSALQADLARDIFGDPNHSEAFEREWSTPTVIELARRIHDDRASERMPILGDALEEAGCTSRRILDHCRSRKPHARGCWVVDGLIARR